MIHPTKILPAFLFALCLLSPVLALAQSPTASNYSEDEVLAICQKAEQGKLTESLTTDGYGKLLAGIIRNIGGKDYIVALTQNHIFKRKGRINAFFAFPFPGSDKQLAFVAEGLSTTPGSLSMADGAILRLVSRVEIFILT